MKRPRRYAIALALAAGLVALGDFPCVAEAHGPVAPIASSYLARVRKVPAGLQAKVIDGDQRMWLSVIPSENVIVLDYRRAPYLRFTRSGVAVNQNSAMYYLNQVPAELVPANLRPRTPPRWSAVSGAHDYSWHDGRLHAFATVALAPGTAYAGPWSIPVRVDGRSSAIAGGLWHADSPSLVWFWPIIVLLACTLAARRIRRPELDARVARVLSLPALLGIATAGVGRELHGRPAVSIFQAFTFAAVVSFVVWALRQVLLRRATYFTYFAISFIAIWEGAELIPTLLDGFVLAAVPAFVARSAAVICLGCGGGLLLIPSRLMDESEPDPATADPSDSYDGDDAGARESYA